MVFDPLLGTFLESSLLVCFDQTVWKLIVQPAPPIVVAAPGDGEIVVDSATVGLDAGILIKIGTGVEK